MAYLLLLIITIGGFIFKIKTQDDYPSLLDAFNMLMLLLSLFSTTAVVIHINKVNTLKATNIYLIEIESPNKEFLKRNAEIMVYENSLFDGIVVKNFSIQDKSYCKKSLQK